MRRKLVQLGQHTLMAAVPSTWVQRHGLKKGDQVEFTEFGNKLILTSTAEIYERKTSLHIPSHKVTVVWRMLQPVYTSGYDEVDITFDDPRTLAMLEQSIQALIGFEIVEVDEGKVKIKSISAQLDEELPTVLGRCWNIIVTMMATYQESLKKRERLQEIYLLEQTMNKYAMFLQRVINRTGYKYPQYTYQIVVFLELAANHIEYLRRHFAEHPRLRIESEAVKEAARLNGLLQRTHSIYARYKEDEFLRIADELPHFKWFAKVHDPIIRMNYTAIAEYLVLISRQVQALHT
jgi:phosphate uptake regulator